MEFKELHRKLSSKEYVPLYLLHGEESYFIDRITKEIEDHVLGEGKGILTKKCYTEEILSLYPY